MGTNNYDCDILNTWHECNVQLVFCAASVLCNTDGIVRLLQYH